MTPTPTRILASALLAASLGSAALPAGAIEYTLTDIGRLGGIYDRTYATGLNASGQVVGYGYRYDLYNSGNSGTEEYQAFVTSANGQGIIGLGTLAGTSWSQARAINNAGLVVGTAGNAGSQVTSAFTSSHSAPTLTPLGTLGGTSSSANAVNASGRVVGTSTDAGGITRAYITGPNAGALSALDATPLGSLRDISANGVNASGQVVGAYVPATTGYRYGYVTGPNGSDVRTLPGPDVAPGHAPSWSPRLFTSAINAQGQTVGFYGEEGADAFLKNPDGTDLLLDFSAAPHYRPGNLGGFGQYGPITNTLALALNDHGQVGGTIVRNDMPGQRYAFITGSDGAGLTEVNSLDFVNQSGPLGFDFISVTGINNAGSFVANASNGHAYLISVIPEPASIALLLAGLGAIGLAVRRKQRMGDLQQAAVG